MVRRFTLHLIWSNSTIVLNKDHLESDLSEGHKKIFKSFEAYLQEGSGWVLEEFAKIDVRLANYVPLQGNSYILTPPILSCKHCLLYVQNNDKCFAWAVLSAIKIFETNPQRVAKYKQFEQELDMDGISNAIQFQQLPKFEKQNGISISLYGNDGEIFPLYISKFEHAFEIDFLLLKDETKFHFVWIKNLSRFVSHLTKHNGEAHYCRYCLHLFCRAHLHT